MPSGIPMKHTTKPLVRNDPAGDRLDYAGNGVQVAPNAPVDRAADWKHSASGLAGDFLPATSTGEWEHLRTCCISTILRASKPKASPKLTFPARPNLPQS